MRHSVPGALLLGAGIVALAPPGRAALAQQSDLPPACAATDSARADSTRAVSSNHGGTALALAVFTFAPSSLLLLPGVRCSADTVRLGFWRPRVVTAFVTGGGAIGDPDADEAGGTLSADVELLWRGVYGVGRLEHFHLPDRLQSRTVRVGYLIHPTPAVAGGVTLGYRGARGRRLPEGVEIGFPIMGPFCRGRPTCWLRWEPAYVISPRRVRLSPRFRLEFPIPQSPLVAGFDVEANGIGKEDVFRVAALLGARYGP